ncbi:replication initiation regulator SeqA [Psychromonas sp. 14N.309.X.WAT.B.A12]|uniref:replication initiation regulator SeqA n=1 Tax=unclassified Psychromonas TaxID=2614957 RepID=UPI0025B17BA7|nr:replication initiation regulator SeqA [Psychromonas sp. 14N.309.X.WAT.B.A12]MDN2663789.1 replication initiation regulator SeqA [Psychromonas sp. 14N.309.X.WAT.B.A12]
MKTIEIEDDLYKHILNNIEAFGETPSQILRRLLALPKENNLVEIEASPIQPPKVETVTSDSTSTEKISTAEQETDNTKGVFVHKGVSELFNDPTFKAETVITNKFMMMLTTMYFEKKAEFIEAAETTKGRTRAYLGTQLEELLNSDNEEELAQFKASKPRAIPNTPYWVITNANTGRKRIILTQMMASMGYPHHLIGRIKEEI